MPTHSLTPVAAQGQPVSPRLIPGGWGGAGPSQGPRPVTALPGALVRPPQPQCLRRCARAPSAGRAARGARCGAGGRRLQEVPQVPARRGRPQRAQPAGETRPASRSGRSCEMRAQGEEGGRGSQEAAVSPRPEGGGEGVLRAGSRGAGEWGRRAGEGSRRGRWRVSSGHGAPTGWRCPSGSQANGSHLSAIASSALRERRESRSPLTPRPGRGEDLGSSPSFPKLA